MVWYALAVATIMNSKEFSKRGVPEISLVFAGVTKPRVGATSNVRLEKASKDPLFTAVDVELRIDEVTLSGFYNDGRYEWSELRQATIERLQSF